MEKWVSDASCEPVGRESVSRESDYKDLIKIRDAFSMDCSGCDRFDVIANNHTYPDWTVCEIFKGQSSVNKDIKETLEYQISRLIESEN